MICRFCTPRGMLIPAMFVVSKLNQSKQKHSKMEATANKTKITIETLVNAPVEKVWNIWSSPEHITKWATPSEDWHTPFSENDLRTGGKFTSRMEAKDGSFGFDFGGVYDNVKTNELIEYTLGDGRKVVTTFTANGNQTRIVQTFEAESENPVEMQRDGWQAILNNFKKYTEAN
jgi:uncharacterized protein YndB with AHSA1/START domain